MKILVQKFGGTSVANSKNRNKVAEKIINKYEEGYKMVAVVSAIGREENPYATDSLINLVDNEVIKKRELDLLMSCGEIISAVVLSNVINRLGYETKVLTGIQGGILTNKEYGRAEILEINPEKILNALKENKIVIVAGFQGGTIDGEITTLGRGGSDTTAVALGEALNCEYVEIYTDVDGIMTADPRIVPDARLIKKMHYSEVYQLAEDGAKVIHPRAVEIAERSNIEVKIKNTLTDSSGTIISNKDFVNAKKNKKFDKNKLITAITYKKNRVQVIIEVDDKTDYVRQLMKEITKNKISIDLINFFTDKKVFTIDKNDLKVLKKILNKNGYNYKVIEKCCKISAIGHRIRGIPGIMAKIYNTLAENGIKILQTADSYTTIWCLTKEEDTNAAINALHKEFHLETE
ncbi:aspartate kinase [Caldisalinibacter kiritimatiensis]|uniref:Aspartokinase n=1 Tax=Caldisalinibacter kiritimatiensis TaxID=1304284 RepID=R1AVL0_9FIRM|nr:aspartate kinase [Caldisalinibacter kiritimatiensis]EOD01238.1 Aspartokinase [Caldisalinibacter kiritimatiensis]